jgi:predicted PurR-regulated permease PerM
MKFNKIIGEELAQQVASTNAQQIQLDDLSNPALKAILNQIQQTKERHAKELENLTKKLEQVRAQTNRQQGQKQQSAGVPGL